ncbi:MAG: Maf family protein [Nitrospiraceae bacterium]
MRFILASTSPRRQELLSLLKIPFDVMAPDFREVLRGGVSAERLAMEFAQGKARSCASSFVNSLVLGSDTLIALEGDILGKPVDLDEARTMLRRLAGREHAIHTAVAVEQQALDIHDVVPTMVRVTMKDFSDDELESYLKTEESLGKAGAYSIQGDGGRLIDRISGDFTAAVGLPLQLVATLLQKHGVPIPVDVNVIYEKRAYPNWKRFVR